MDKLLVSISGFVSIIAIYWFFFGKKPSFAKATEGQGSNTIIVNGGYKPNTIEIPQNKKTVLIFIRKDENSCLEELIIPDFKIKKYLPLHTPVTVTLSPTRPGTFNFHCGMNMFHGNIKVT